MIGFSLRANGRRSCSAGPSTAPSSLVSPSADAGLAAGSARAAPVARCTSRSWLAIAPRAAFEASTSGRDLLVLLADPAEEDVHVVDQAGEVLLALGDLAVEPGQAPVDRAEAAEQLAEVLAAPLEALAAADQQQPQIGPGVGVEHLEDLVEVDVGRGVGDRDRVALLELAAGGCPGRARGTCP